jgi:hypothetical protein
VNDQGPREWKLVSITWKWFHGSRLGGRRDVEREEMVEMESREECDVN